jgi:hypothetical protein
MYRLLALVLTTVTALPAPALLAADIAHAPAARAAGQISGQASDLMGRRLAGVTVRLRAIGMNPAFVGSIAGTTVSGSTGEFSFSGLPTGNYVVEVGNSAGRVIGTSRIVPLTTSQMIAGGVGITAVTEAEMGSGAGQAQAGAAAGSFFTSTLGIVVVAGVVAAASVGVYEATKSSGSPSR